MKGINSTYLQSLSWSQRCSIETHSPSSHVNSPALQPVSFKKVEQFPPLRQLTWSPVIDHSCFPRAYSSRLAVVTAVALLTTSSIFHIFSNLKGRLKNEKMYVVFWDRGFKNKKSNSLNMVQLKTIHSWTHKISVTLGLGSQRSNKFF